MNEEESKETYYAKENILSAVLHFSTAEKSTARITSSQRSITSG